MSEKDKIREMVYALARGDHDAAQAASKEVFAAKSKRIAEAALNDVEIDDTEESEEDLEEGMHNPNRRHMSAGSRHMRRKSGMHRDMHRRSDEARRDYDDEDEDGMRVKKRRTDRSMKRRRPRRSDMYEMNDTGSDSATVKGSNDHPQDDNTQRKGSVSDSGVVAGSHDDMEDNTQRKGGVKDSGSVKGSHDDGDSGAK